MDKLFTAILTYLANRGVCHADGCTYARKAVCSCGLADVRAAVKAYAQVRIDQLVLLRSAIDGRVDVLEDNIRVHVKAKALGWSWRDEANEADKRALEQYKALRAQLESGS